MRIRGRNPRRAAIGVNLPSFYVVAQLNFQNLLQSGLMLFIQNRKRDFDAAVKVSLHPVGGSKKNTSAAVIVKEEDSRVFEIAVDDRNDANPLREARHSRLQAAHAPHDQIDHDARLAGAIKLLDDRRVDETIHFDDDARGPPAASVFRFLADARQEMFSQANRRQNQMIESLRPGVPCKQVEKLGEILAEGFKAGKKPKVAVNARGARVVVAGGEGQ